ncbi:MAG: ABC transporter substrate-binding protein [Oceanicaulis sp.]
MIARLAISAGLALASAATAAGAEPPRVVSLDYCADQYVLALADPDQILAVSVQADDAHSALREEAAGHRQVRDAAEDVLALDPDLVVRSYGGDARARNFYARLGVPVFDLGYANDFEDIRSTIRRTADTLGHPERGEALIARMDAALDEAAHGPRLGALYLTPSGVTSGAGTMIHQILAAANLENLAARGGASGWRALPLEQLALESPQLVVTAFFDDGSAPKDSWAVSDHPVFRRLEARAGHVALDGALTACGAWFMADAALQARRQANALAGGRDEGVDRVSFPVYGPGDRPPARAARAGAIP